jgi:hypothetical protein
MPQSRYPRLWIALLIGVLTDHTVRQMHIRLATLDVKGSLHCRQLDRRQRRRPNSVR